MRHRSRQRCDRPWDETKLRGYPHLRLLAVEKSLRRITNVAKKVHMTGDSRMPPMSAASMYISATSLDVGTGGN